MRHLLRPRLQRRRLQARSHLWIILSTCESCWNRPYQTRLLTLLPYRYDFEEAAAATASKKAYAFYSTAATDCWTRDANEAMIKRVWFRPRVMKDVAVVDTSSTVLNIPVKMPLFVCPTGLAKLINPEGEQALARAAKSSGILEIVSRQLSVWLGVLLTPARSHPRQATPLRILSTRHRTIHSSSSFT